MGYDYIPKLKAMLAKANSTTSSEEADSIMQKVRVMMERHGVSLLSINTHLSDDPVGITHPGIHFWHADNWARGLYAAIGRYFGCRVYFIKTSNRTEVLINGRESCRATFTLMAPYLFKSVRRMAEHSYKRGLYPHLSAARRDIANALALRLHTLWKEAEGRVLGPRTAQGFNALVPVEVLDIVEEEAFGKVPKRGGRKTVTRVGVLLAEQISLAEQLGEIKDKERLLQ